MMGAELCLLGRFQHVPECLAHRVKESQGAGSDHTKLLRRYHPTRYQELSAPPSRLFKTLLSIVRAAPLTRPQRLRCQWAAALLLFKAEYYGRRQALSEFRREKLGLSRQNLRALFPR